MILTDCYASLTVLIDFIIIFVLLNFRVNFVFYFVSYPQSV